MWLSGWLALKPGSPPFSPGWLQTNLLIRQLAAVREQSAANTPAGSKGTSPRKSLAISPRGPVRDQSPRPPLPPPLELLDEVGHIVRGGYVKTWRWREWQCVWAQRPRGTTCMHARHHALHAGPCFLCACVRAIEQVSLPCPLRCRLRSRTPKSGRTSPSWPRRSNTAAGCLRRRDKLLTPRLP
jgi:hypothetical protein